MEPKVSFEELIVRFFNKLYELPRNASKREDLIRELSGILEDVMKLDGNGFHSILYLLLINLSEDLQLSGKDIVQFLLKSHKGLVTSFKKVLKAWLDNQKEVIEYLENSGNAEHPLANVFIISEILGLLDPLDPQSYVIRGNIYLNYLKVLKEYEVKGEYPLRVQVERAFKNALELYSKAISMDINCYEGYLGLARLYSLVGDLNQALINYENALRCKRTCEVLKEIANVYNLVGDKDTADRYMRECKDT
ncbi:MAG: hypothetical protein QW596_02070 [Sulfolobales archaeon]